jgi:Ras-related protein Rab-21
MTEDLVIVVVANKLDLANIRREVSYDDAQQYITRVLGPDTLLYEVSAKEDNG